MSLCASILPDGGVVVKEPPLPLDQCQAVLLTPQEFNAFLGTDMTALGVDAGSIANAIAFGFAAVVVPWLLGYSVGVARSFLRKL